MSTTTKQYGVTPPISNANSSAREMELNNELIEELKAQGSFESEAETRKRHEVIKVLQDLVLEFVKQVSIDKKMGASLAQDAGGKIFTFGSYRLGAYGPGSDIDALVVVPKHVTREHFFSILEKMLRDNPQCEECTAVPDAFVPIIKIKFMGISVDMIFAKLDLAQVPVSLTLKDKNLLKNIDEKDLRALNGTRVTDEILELVPNPTVFKHALRAVKMWAQRRAIYSNVHGFPGGVAWAMMVARICQLYPNAVSSTIIGKFFNILTKWNWPQPVMLKKIEDGPLQVRVWNPQLYAQDRYHKMPVITPAYPSMCATHNISNSTKQIILKELKRGGEVVNEIMTGSKTWSDFFVKHTFFTDYKYYLSINACTKGTQDDQLKWEGMVESRLRHLVNKLEIVEEIELAHPYIKTLDKCYRCNTDEEALKIADGDVAPGQYEDENAPVSVWTSRFFIGLKLNMDDKVKHKKLDIQWPCQEFHEMCKKWPSYDANMHSVHIKNVRVYDLPEEVFDNPADKPQREKKRKRKLAEGSAKRPKSVSMGQDGDTTAATPAAATDVAA